MTPEECSNIKIEHAVLLGRVDAISERLDEVLDELKRIKLQSDAGFNTWINRWVPLILLVALLGDKAVPLLTKVL